MEKVKIQRGTLVKEISKLKWKQGVHEKYGWTLVPEEVKPLEKPKTKEEEPKEVKEEAPKKKASKKKEESNTEDLTGNK